MDEGILVLDGITKSFDGQTVLKGISLTVQSGEFITLLGASGCGKTTTLRVIAGLEEPDGGRVLLNGEDVTDKEPNHRNVNTVFQNYALFPHMNVYDNIAYGMKLKKVSKSEIQQKVTAMLNLVQLPDFEKRMPSEMSGGQKQRVAIARALVNNPAVLLLDEPLGALDLQLRRQMQLELKRLQKKLGITFIYITHDQEEAINMSDRIAVMKNGLFEQIGTPTEVYDHPRTSYVAHFVGSANILNGTIKADCGEQILVKVLDDVVAVKSEGYHPQPGAAAIFAVRSEHIEISRSVMDNSLKAVVQERSFVGGMLRISTLLTDGTEVVVRRHGIDFSIEPGEIAYLHWPADNAVFVDRGNEQ